MSDTSTTAPGGREPGRLPLSRRRVLTFGLALLPGVLGARTLERLLRGADASAVAAADATSPADQYDPAVHRWGFVVDTTTCIGCGRCVEACKLENHVPEEPIYNRTWIELHALMDDGTVQIESPDGGIHGFAPDVAFPTAPGATVKDAYFVPRLCMQCENPPCTWVCPVSATFRAEDGVVFVDEKRCIGCGYCLVACPYGARYMVPAGDTTPKGVSGVVDKCTFCYHRITRGMLPACAEVCPVNARIFGDLNDPSSPVSVARSEKRVRAIKPALGTKPRVVYTGLEGEVQ
jgi:Fe-S-cluster-containing dehydrogenase component